MISDDLNVLFHVGISIFNIRHRSIYILKSKDFDIGLKGPLKYYVTQMGVGDVKFSRKKRYKRVNFNVISVTRGWVGVQFPGKKCYVTLEWPHLRR